MFQMRTRVRCAWSVAGGLATQPFKAPLRVALRTFQTVRYHTATIYHRRACRQEQSARATVALAVDERPFNPKPTVSSEYELVTDLVALSLVSAIVRFSLRHFRRQMTPADVRYEDRQCVL